MLILWSFSCICGHLVKPEGPQRAEIAPSTSLVFFPEQACRWQMRTDEGLSTGWWSSPALLCPHHSLSYLLRARELIAARCSPSLSCRGLLPGLAAGKHAGSLEGEGEREGSGLLFASWRGMAGPPLLSRSPCSVAPTHPRLLQHGPWRPRGTSSCPPQCICFLGLLTKHPKPGSLKQLRCVLSQFWRLEA